MPTRLDTMMSPSIEELLERTGSKFTLVTLSATRARQINAYFNQLGEGLGTIVPPQVTSVARRPLSIAFEEVSGGKIVPIRPGEADRDEAPEEPGEEEAGATELVAVDGGDAAETADSNGAEAETPSGDAE